MAKGTRGRRRIASRQCRPTPYSMDGDGTNPKKCSHNLKKDWEDVTCSVCMEYPHNAVLLLCSSHDKGCRPYMCGTSFRYSNCLDQYKKAYTKPSSAGHGNVLRGLDDNPNVDAASTWPVAKCEATELACPLCRGQVKGWTIVEPAREYLNCKKRNCMQDNCSFVGTFKELRRHVRAEHPCARPREVDPALEQKWTRLERERERDDVISTIRSSMPGAVVFGDYVVEGNPYDDDDDSDEEEDGFDVDVADRNGGFEVGFDGNLVNVFLLLHAFGSGGEAGQGRGTRRHRRDSDHPMDGASVGFGHSSPAGAFELSDEDSESDDDRGGNNDISLVGRLRRQGRVLLERPGRRRRRGESDAGGR